MVKLSIKVISYLIIVLVFTSTSSMAQNDTVNWLSFEELESEFVKEPKKVIIHFYADWCVYCKKMEEDVYTKPEVVKTIEDDYYAVKFNVESTDIISFGGREFKNLNVGRQRNPNHQIAEYLANQKEKGIVLPATVILNEKFEINQRFFTYLSPKSLLKILKY